MRLRYLTPALAACLATSLPAQQRGDAARADSAGCSALAVALDSLVLHGRRDMPIVLWHVTQPVREGDVTASYWRTLRTVPWVGPGTWSSFRRRNEKARPACRTLPLPNPLVHRSEATDGPALSRTKDVEEHWRLFRDRYGASLSIASSAVGLDDSGRQALVVVDYGCGGLCGGGHVVLLERDAQERWRIRRMVMTWVS